MNCLKKKAVVVPVDFSEQSLEAVNNALEFVESPAAIHVVHVVEHIPMEYGSVWTGVDDKSRSTEAMDMMRKMIPVKGVDLKVLVGDPGTEINQFAENLEADLIVMPSAGRTGLSHLLLGSVAERVTRHAHCPVLILRD